MIDKHKIIIVKLELCLNNIYCIIRIISSILINQIIVSIMNNLPF